MTQGEECWLAVVGYEGLYEVSSLGRVRSLPRYVSDEKGKERLLWGCTLRTATNMHGYLTVGLSKDRIQKTRLVHQLVCEAFHGPRPSPKHHARHLNDCKFNNWVENVAWGTAKENYADALRNGRRPRATRCKNGHPYNEQNTRYDARTGWRTCRVCARERYKAYQTRRSALAMREIWF